MVPAPSEDSDRHKGVGFQDGPLEMHDFPVSVHGKSCGFLWGKIILFLKMASIYDLDLIKMPGKMSQILRSLYVGYTLPKTKNSAGVKIKQAFKFITNQILFFSSKLARQFQGG